MIGQCLAQRGHGETRVGVNRHRGGRVALQLLGIDVDANDLDIIAEPNYIQIGSGKSRTENDKIKIISPYVVIESDGSND